MILDSEKMDSGGGDTQPPLGDAPVIVAEVTEHYFGDGNPGWEGQLAGLDVALERISFTKRLRRKPFPSEFAGAAELAEDTVLCEPGSRCRSAACPECARAAQKLLTEHVRAYCETDLVVRADNGRPDISYVAVSVVPPGVRARQGEISKRGLSHAKKELRHTLLGSAALEFGVCAFDFSLNDDTAKGLGIEWQPHFHGILGLNDKDAVETALRAKYPETDEIPSPVVMTDYDLSNLGASYVFKPNICRRWAYKDTGNPYRAPFWNTKPYRLRAKPHIEIALLLDYLGFDKRILWLNMPKVLVRFCTDGSVPPDTP